MDIKELHDFDKIFCDVISNSKFKLLKIDDYGLLDNTSLLDNDDKLIEMTKDLVCRFICYKISSIEKYRSRYINILKSYLILDPESNVPKINYSNSFDNLLSSNIVETDIYLKIKKLMNFKEKDNDILLEKFIINKDNKVIYKKLYKFIQKYYKIFLFSISDNENLNKNDKGNLYKKIIKSNIKDVRNLTKKRFIDKNCIIKEDFQEKLKFINNCFSNAGKEIL